MTDEELKALVAGIAVAQDRTDAELKALVAGIAVSQDRIDAELKALAASQDRTEEMVKAVAAQQAKTDAQLAKTDAQLAKTDAQLAKTDAQLAKTDAQLAKTDARLDRMSERVDRMAEKVDRVADKVDRVAQMYGGVSNNLGDAAEEFYYNSISANPVLDGVRFDFLVRNTERKMTGSNGNGLANEFDLILVNGHTVWVVEIKYKAHEKDLQRLVEVKAVNFPRLFPEYAGHEQRFALAAFHIHDELKHAALAQGVTVLQRKGDVIESIAA